MGYICFFVGKIKVLWMTKPSGYAHNKEKEVCGIEKVDSKEIWMNYFNETLFKTGVINKNEHDKMAQLIRKKCHTPTYVGSKNIK